jgi:hypothetical protein
MYAHDLSLFRVPADYSILSPLFCEYFCTNLPFFFALLENCLDIIIIDLSEFCEEMFLYPVLGFKILDPPTKGTRFSFPLFLTVCCPSVTKSAREIGLR